MFMSVLKKDENLRTMYNFLRREVTEVKQAILQYMISGSSKHRKNDRNRYIVKKKTSKNKYKNKKTMIVGINFDSKMEDFGPYW